jgi:hypothetical protein
MRGSCRVAVAAVSLIIASSTAARADPITIVRDARTAVATLDGQHTSAPVSDTMASTVSSPTARATATLGSSYTNSLHWFGAGEVNMPWESPQSLNGDAGFKTDFRVTSPVTYAFGATLAATLGPCCSRAESFALLGLSTGQRDAATGDPLFTPIFSFVNAAGSGNRGTAITPSIAGRLEPGDYFFFLDAAAQAFNPFRSPGAAGALFSFAMDFAPAPPAPTPEPASLLLIGGGLAGLLRYRGRSAHSGA